MFDNDKKITGPGTVVGANVKLTGVLKDINDITVHGSVDGEVSSEKNVVIAETASIKGPVSAEVVTVAGKVNGSIEAWKKLEILPTGKVHGSIATEELIIRSGAIFNGKSKMTKDAKKETADEENEKVEAAPIIKTDKKNEKTAYELE